MVRKQTSIKRMSIKTRVAEIHGRQLTSFSLATLQMLGVPLPKSDKNVAIPKMTPSLWIKEPQFYFVAVIYTASRFFRCISETYVIFYVENTLSLPKQYASIIPLVMFVTGLVISCLMKHVTRRVGLKVSFVISGIVGLGILGTLDE